MKSQSNFLTELQKRLSSVFDAVANDAVMAIIAPRVVIILGTWRGDKAPLRTDCCGDLRAGS